MAIHFRTEAARAEEVVREAKAFGVDARGFGGDVADREAIADVVRRAAQWKGRLDGLVTSAGIYRGPSLEEVRAPDWDETERIDLEGTFWAVQAATPFLRKSDRAAVVTVSSVLGAHAAVGGAPYQAIKGAIEQLTRALALELAPSIRVNSVAPGFVRTDMNRAGHEDPVFRQKVAKATPLGRWGEPDDIAPVVRYLLSRQASWVTGIVLGVDGGIALR